MSGMGSALATILFTDLVGSTELLARAGDEEAQRIFRAHHDLLADAAAAHKGEEDARLGSHPHRVACASGTTSSGSTSIRVPRPWQSGQTLNG